MKRTEELDVALLTVVQDQSGDTAHADTPEAAIVAARTLCQDRRDDKSTYDTKLTASFYNAQGDPVRRFIPERNFWINVNGKDTP